MTDTRFTSLLPPLKGEEFQSLKAGIREHGVLVEILRDEYGTTIDGAHRERAVAELRAEGHKVPDPPVRVLCALDDATKTAIVYQIHYGRRNMDLELSMDVRRKLIEAQILVTPSWSDRQIADKVGVHHETVGAARQRLVAAGRLEPQERTVGADGKSRPSMRPRRTAASSLGVCAVCDRDVLPGSAVVSEDGVWHLACSKLAEAVATAVYSRDASKVEESVTEDNLNAVNDEEIAAAGAYAVKQAADEANTDDSQWGRPVDEGPAPYQAAYPIVDEEPDDRTPPAALDQSGPPAKPLEVIRVDNARQAGKLKDLAEAGRLGDVMSKGINAAHKQLREHRRHEEIREHAAAASVDAEQLRVECMDALGFLRSLPTCSADMIWTDPPYYLASRGGGTKVGDSYTSFDAGGDGWDDDQWDDEHEFLDWLYEVVRECNRVLKPTGNMVMCMDRALISHLWDQCRIPEVHPHGLNPKNVLAWHKTNAAPNARGNFDSSLELAVWAACPHYSFQRPATGQCGTVWAGPFVSGPTRDRWPHPTAKPVAWIQSHLEVLSTPGQLVVDPFGGSGAAVEAALRLGRRVIANDRSQKFADMCRVRGMEVLTELAGDRGWVEAVPCAGCRQPVNGEETEETGEGRMHTACAQLWREREEAVGECALCGKSCNANTGGIGDYGDCHDECSQLAWRKMKPTRERDVQCPACNAKAGKRCRNLPPGFFHDLRTNAARQRQQADFANLAMEVTA